MCSNMKAIDGAVSENPISMKKSSETEVSEDFGGDCWTRTSDLLRVKQAGLRPETIAIKGIARN